MKKLLFISVMALIVTGFTACNNKKAEPVVQDETPIITESETPVENEAPVADEVMAEMTVTGKITKIENGKDGYMATLKSPDNKEYVTTISVVNFQKSGATYKKHEVGETITVKGSSWVDTDGITHITASHLE